MDSPRAVEIPYALRAGEIVHVSEVARGLACGCFCGLCGAELIARQGTRREHHFAHFHESNCPGAGESLLHRLAKELLSRATVLALPAFIYRAKHKSRFGTQVSIEREIFVAARMNVDSAAVEQPLGRIVPDLLLRSGESTLILEIAVSHPVDRAKLRHIRRMDIPTLELRLTLQDLLLCRALLLQRLVENTAIKTWLFHPAQRPVEAEWVKTRRRDIKDSRTRARDYLALGFKNRSPQLKRVSRSDWRRENAWAERFNRKHGRYPNSEEILAFKQMKPKR